MTAGNGEICDFFDVFARERERDVQLERFAPIFVIFPPSILFGVYIW